MKLGALSLCLSIVAGCSGSDDAGLMRGPAARNGGETNQSTDATEPKSDGTDPNGNDAGAGDEDSGATPGDAASDSKTIDPNPYAGAPAYVATLGPSARKAAHPFTNDNPAGKACFTCHGDTGSGTPMAFGGTIYTSAAGTTPASKVEIRVKDKDGKAISAWSDADGNFYFLVNPNGDLNWPSHAGIRDAKGTKLMSKDIANGNCNGCHNATGAGRLVAP